MNAKLVLSIFPGIGLLDMAFEREGFCVVRGPDVIWGGDVRKFHPPAGVFAGARNCRAIDVFRVATACYQTESRLTFSEYGGYR